MIQQKPLVSIRLMVYNNELFIKDTLNGILMQRTNFKVEVVVGDDFSTDHTLEIIKTYKNTENINIIILDRPVGGEYWQKRKNKNASVRTNFIDIIENCHGKYIALLDGDDYWTDPLKLQKQVDFMEGNPDCGICFHNVQIYEQGSKALKEDWITRDVPDTTTIFDLAKGNFIHTPSVLLRNNFNLPKWFVKSPIGDWTLYMIAVKDLNIKKLPEHMAIYRVHCKSIWATKTQDYRNKETLKSVRLIVRNLPLPADVREVLKRRLNKGSKNKLLKLGRFLKGKK